MRFLSKSYSLIDSLATKIVLLVEEKVTSPQGGGTKEDWVSFIRSLVEEEEEEKVCPEEARKTRSFAQHSLVRSLAREEEE